MTRGLYTVRDNIYNPSLDPWLYFQGRDYFERNPNSFGLEFVYLFCHVQFSIIHDTFFYFVLSPPLLFKSSPKIKSKLSFAVNLTVLR